MAKGEVEGHAYRGGRGGLGGAVALHHRREGAEDEVKGVLGDRRPARDADAHAAAERPLCLPEDEEVPQRAIAAAVLDVGHLGLHGGIEELLLEAMHLPGHGVAHVLEHLRHAHKERRADYLQVRQQRLCSVGREVHDGARQEHAQDVLALEDVGKGKEAQVNISWKKLDCRSQLRNRGGHRDDVFVPQLDSLRHASGAAGVHDGADAVPRRGRILREQAGVRCDSLVESNNHQTLGLQRLLRVRVALPVVHNDLEVSTEVVFVHLILEKSGDALERLVLAREDLRTRVGHDEAGRIRPKRVVHRDRRPTVGGASQVGEHPLHAVRRPDSDLLALPDPV
mmetsp:Transcript_69484/g.214760  ORF Transcript_69484/g.214760 Transcript_69484/m.214760 type:complete len:339 (-) Transcript_69484:627-1643(-)